LLASVQQDTISSLLLFSSVICSEAMFSTAQPWNDKHVRGQIRKFIFQRCVADALKECFPAGSVCPAQETVQKRIQKQKRFMKAISRSIHQHPEAIYFAVMSYLYSNGRVPLQGFDKIKWRMVEEIWLWPEQESNDQAAVSIS
jgi:hypothetical protein